MKMQVVRLLTIVFVGSIAVYNKYIQPLDSLTAVDPALNAPPMVQVTFQPPNASPCLRGVVSSVSTKYTMFMPDGTPVRATAT